MVKKVKSLIVLAFPYIIIVLLPIISTVYQGRSVFDNYEKQMIAEMQRSIENSFDRFLEKIDKVESLGYQLVQSDVMTNYNLISKRKFGHTVIDFMEVRDLLHDSIANSDVSAVYFYDQENQRIISSKEALNDVQMFLRYAYRYENHELQEGIERLNEISDGIKYSAVTAVKMHGKSAEVVEYSVAWPVGSARNYTGKLVFALDVKDIFSDFEEIVENGGEFYVYDKGEQLLYGSGVQYEELFSLEETSGLELADQREETVYGMVLCSDDGLWKVKMYLPDLRDSGEENALSGYILIMVVVPILFSVVLCIYFTHKNHREISELLKRFTEQNEKLTEDDAGAVGYKMLHEYVDRMFQENAGFKEQITSYEQAYKYEVFDKIIRNTYGSREEIAEELEEAGFRIGEVRCIVLCMRYEDSSYRAFLSDNLTIKNLVKELLGVILDREFELFDTTARETICVLAMRNDESEDVVMRELISRINTEIVYCYDVEITMGAGGSVDSIWRIGDSYAQAKAVIRYNETSEKKISLYSELEQMKDLYYYPQELEEKIYNYVAVGKAKEAENILWKIYEENFGEHSEMLSVGAIEMLKSRMVNMIVSIAQKNGISIDSAIWPFGGEQNVRKCFELACDQVVNAAEQIAKNKKKLQERSVSNVMEYVKENYCDSKLSLQELAHKYGYTENYLSGLFKSLYGENLSAVIEKLRIEKACECIRDTNMKVEEIAEAVGYTSATSFRRAFKRIVGVSPKEYKEM